MHDLDNPDWLAWTECQQTQKLVDITGSASLITSVRVNEFAELPSTNDWLLANPLPVSQAGYAVCMADYQTAGKGRSGKQWQAPPNANMLLSVGLWVPAATVARVPVTLLVGAAVAEVLEAALASEDCGSDSASDIGCADVGGASIQLKWPNDLWLGNAKLGGVLVESRFPSASSALRAPNDKVWLVIGIGLNVNWPLVITTNENIAKGGEAQASVPAKSYPVTSLLASGCLSSASCLTPLVLARLISSKIGQLLVCKDESQGQSETHHSQASQLLSEWQSYWHAQWGERDVLLGKQVSVHQAGLAKPEGAPRESRVEASGQPCDELGGQACGVNRHGHLQLKIDSAMVSVITGNIRLV